jgi:predicted RNase H-related nuclease YkuK (DUF458 family)
VGIHIDGRHGSKVFRTGRIKIKRRLGLREKLWQEVAYALQIAESIRDVIGKRPFSVHLDLNPKEQEASSAIVKEAVAMVQANGFKAVVKPDAHLSTYASDHFVRGKDS